MRRLYLYILFIALFSTGKITVAKNLEDPEMVSIPSGYTKPLSGLGSYKVYNEAENWSNAKLKCEGDGAELAIINSRAEAIYVRKLLTNSRPFIGSSYPGAWIGFRDVNSRRKWYTLKNESLEAAGYSHWWPKSSRGFGMCGTIKTSGRLDAVDCNDSLILICEYDTNKK